MAACEFLEKCQLGETLDGELIIDAHAHMGPWHNFNIPYNDAGGMVERMDQLGFDICISSPHIAIGPGYREGNREVADAAAQFPGRFVPYVTINPNYPEAEVREEISHWHDNGGIKGFKIHPSLHGYKVNGPGYAPMFEYAREYSTPILSHSWAGDAQAGVTLLSSMAADMPNVAFIIGHSASGWPMIDESCTEAKRRENVHLDLTGSILVYMAIETMVNRVGADRILFGTDIPFIDAAPGLGRVLMARLSDDEKRKILGLNAKAIFGL